MDKAKLGLKIQSLRKAGGFSQRSLANKAGVAYATIQDLEKGEGNPTVDTLDALSKTLGDPLIELYEGRIPAEHLSDAALSGLKQESKSKRNRGAAQMLGARGKSLAVKTPPTLDDAFAILSRYRGLKPLRKALVAMLLFDDEAYILPHPQLAPLGEALLKAAEPKK